MADSMDHDYLELKFDINFNEWNEWQENQLIKEMALSLDISEDDISVLAKHKGSAKLLVSVCKWWKKFKD